MKRLIAAFAAATMSLAPLAVAARAPAPEFTAAQVLPICDKGLVAAMAGHDARTAILAEIRTMGAEQQKAVLTVCAIYLTGAVMALKHAQEATVPAGAARSI